MLLCLIMSRHDEILTSWLTDLQLSVDEDAYYFGKDFDEEASSTVSWSTSVSLLDDPYPGRLCLKVKFALIRRRKHHLSCSLRSLCRDEIFFFPQEMQWIFERCVINRSPLSLSRRFPRFVASDSWLSDEMRRCSKVMGFAWTQNSLCVWLRTQTLNLCSIAINVNWDENNLVCESLLYLKKDWDKRERCRKRGSAIGEPG